MKDKYMYMDLLFSFARLTTASQVVDHTPSECRLRESAAAT